MIPRQPLFRMKSVDAVELKENYSFYFGSELITIGNGFTHDGNTIPRQLWTLLGLSKFGYSLPASLVHDYIYINHGIITKTIKISRQWADEKYISDLIALGLIKKHFAPVYRAVLRYGGLYFWNEKY